MTRKLRAAVLGFGGMGHFHAVQYAAVDDCELVAVADAVPAQLDRFDAEINLGNSGEVSLRDIRKYHSYEELIAAEELDFIDICLPTDLHARYAVRAMKDGLHVLSEKPMAPTLAQADAMIRTAQQTGRMLMVAQCLRFYPAYEALKAAIDGGKYGRLLRLDFRRTSGLPHGYGDWFRDGARSGGALLDLHVHDTDFVNYVFGTPDAVATFGCTHHSGRIDDSLTNYIYDGGPLISAEASWSRGKFKMGFAAVFEDATLTMDGDVTRLELSRLDQEPEPVELADDNGYRREIAYFARCIRSGRPPQTSNPFSTRETVRIALAEERSARNGGRRVRL